MNQVLNTNQQSAPTIDTYLSQNPQAVQVFYPACAVSQHSLYSLRYEVCCGFALFDQAQVGLSHMFGSHVYTHEGFLDQMLTDMRKHHPIGVQRTINAFVFGLDEQRTYTLSQLCKQKGLQVIGEHSYDCDDSPKDVLVTPNPAQIQFFGERTHQVYSLHAPQLQKPRGFWSLFH